MPEQPVNPFGPQQLPAQPQLPPQAQAQLPPQAMGGMASLTPQEGQLEGGDYYGMSPEMSPEVVNMMWQPQQPEWVPPQARLTPQGPPPQLPPEQQQLPY